jgi:hypothetical protein
MSTGFDIDGMREREFAQRERDYNTEINNLCEERRRLLDQNTRLREVCRKWADIIQGGDKLERCEPWAQEAITELRSAGHEQG